MKKCERGVLFLTAAAMTAAILTGCDKPNAYWDDSLPEVRTTTPAPTVVYETEETTITEPITLPPKESTSRTAAAEPSNALATTTATEPPETTIAPETEPTVSTVPDVPNVPISQYTTTQASFPTMTGTDTSAETAPPAEGSSGTNTDSGTNTAAATGERHLSQVTGTLPSQTAAALTDPFAPYTAKPLENRYLYGMLDEKRQYIYDKLADAFAERASEVSFDSSRQITAEDYQFVYDMLFNDEDAYFYIGTKMQYAVNSATKQLSSAQIFYKYSKEQIRTMQSRIDDETDKILARITPEMSEYDIVKLFYDYLAENVEYDESLDNCRDIYGVFVDKKAICGGYSKAFSYLCNKAGIKTLTITGDADGTPHMWNMALIGGEWYHIDATYAVTNNSVGKYVRYDYFCITDEVIERTRTVYEKTYQYPKATAERCSYFVRNKLIASSADEVKQMLSEQMIAAAKSKSLVAQVQCSDKNVYYEAVHNLFGTGNMQAIGLIESAAEKSGNKFTCDVYDLSDGTYTIKLFLEYSD